MASNPNPLMPADLAEIIATHKALIGGFTMMADEASGATTDDQKDAGGFKSPESRDSVLADLATERAERKRLAAQLQELTEALGADPKAKDFDAADAIAKINARLDVAELARKHGVTDDDDIEVLSSIDDPVVRAKAAERFAAATKGADGSEGEQKSDPKREVLPRPKPDGTQGPKGEIQRPDPAPGVPRMTAALEEALGPR